MSENEVAAQIVDAAYRIHRQLGPGLFESVYEAILAHELEKRGLLVERQRVLPVVYDAIRFDEGYRVDLLVERCVIVELKSLDTVAPVHTKQLLTYLRLANLHLGLLINFGSPTIKEGITRVVNNLRT